MNFVCVQNYKNLVGSAILRGFSQLPNIEIAVLENASSGKGKSTNDEKHSGVIFLSMEDDGFEESVKKKLTENNVFIFNSKFINELEEIDVNYSDRVCDELNNLFRVLKKLIGLLYREDKKGKFLFITTNPGISHSSDFPTSPIYDEAIHALIRSLAKEFKSAQIAFHGLCIEAIFEMVDKSELRDYRTKMKVYATQKSPIKSDVLIAFIKNLVLTDFRLTSGNILYVAEGLDQVNF